MTLLDKLKADLVLAEKATNGPWEAECYVGLKGQTESYIESSKGTPARIYSTITGRSDWGEPQCFADSQFIAASRTRWPATTRALIKAIEALEVCRRKLSSGVALEALAEIEKELAQ